MSYFGSLRIHDARAGMYHADGAAFGDPILECMPAGEVEALTNGELICGSRDDRLTGIAVDPAALKPGNLFFALPRPGGDGDLHIPAALARGAAGAVVDHQPEGIPSFPRDRFLLRVRDTRGALDDLAAAVRGRWRGSLVAVTGGLGKTLTCDFIHQVLQAEHSVYFPLGGPDSFCRMPLSLFGLSPADHIGILEASPGHPSEIAELCRLARPAAAVVTNIAGGPCPATTMTAGIAGLARALETRGTLVYNADDPVVRDLAAASRGRTISFGFSPDADVRAGGLEQAGLQETRFDLTVEGVTRRAMIPLAGGHLVMNALAAVALGRYYRLGMDQIVESLRHLRGRRMRGQALRFLEGFTLIDDTYDSNPESLSRMIDTVAAIRPYSRRILIAGEMLGLGTESSALHHACGVYAARKGIDAVVGVRGAAQDLVRGAVEAGMASSCAHFFSDVNPATNYISRKVQPGDLVLVKGSRDLRLERIVQILRSEYAEQTA